MIAPPRLTRSSHNTTPLGEKKYLVLVEGGPLHKHEIGSTARTDVKLRRATKEDRWRRMYHRLQISHQLMGTVEDWARLCRRLWCVCSFWRDKCQRRTSASVPTAPLIHPKRQWDMCAARRGVMGMDATQRWSTSAAALTNIRGALPKPFFFLLLFDPGAPTRRRQFQKTEWNLP